MKFFICNLLFLLLGLFIAETSLASKSEDFLVEWCPGEMVVDENGLKACLVLNKDYESFTFDKNLKLLPWVTPERMNGYSKMQIGQESPKYISFHWDYERPLTFYNKVKKEDTDIRFPSFVEECHDSIRFAQYSESVSVSSSVQASFTLDELGLSASVEERQTLSFTRTLNGVKGEEAIHKPVVYTEDLDGFTIMQLVNKDTGENLFSPEKFDFKAYKVNPLIRAQRSNVRKCD